MIAHVSSPLDTGAGPPGLVKFIQDELAWGLTLAVEAQLSTGNGTEPNLRGFSVTSGIQTQEFVTDALTTIRNAPSPSWKSPASFPVRSSCTRATG